MRTPTFSADAIATLLRKQTIADMADLQRALGTTARRTVFRKLAELPYRSSYWHRGRFYTLDELTRFDELGLWSFDDVWFSAYGTLLSTAETIVGGSEAGYSVEELDNVVHVGTKDVLRKLVTDERLRRERLGGQWRYTARDPAMRRQQLQVRQLQLSHPGVAQPLPEAELVSEELGAATILFVSVLDEQQRRLYAGLESLKAGHGGERQIAQLLGLDASTVARGRHQLLDQQVEVGRTRRKGGGRKTAGKNPRKSSNESKL